MSEVKLDETGLTTPSISLGDNTLSSEGDKLLWNGEEFKSGAGGHSVGEQWISMDGTIPFGGLPFNGQILNTADYQALYNWAKDNNLFKTESEWLTLKTNNNNNVPFYSKEDDTPGLKAKSDCIDIEHGELLGTTTPTHIIFNGKSYDFNDVVYENINSLDELPFTVNATFSDFTDPGMASNYSWIIEFEAKHEGVAGNNIVIEFLGSNSPSNNIVVLLKGGVDSSEPSTFRVPLFRGYLKADSGSGYIKQGLPDHTHTITSGSDITNEARGNTATGGMDTVSNYNASSSYNFSSSKASVSNSIYGRSSNVTPETSKVLVGVYAFNTIVNAAILDATSKITSHILVSDAARPDINIGYPYSDASGALITLRSVNYPAAPGSFSIFAKDATRQKVLVGRPDGTLIWDGKSIIRLVEYWKSGTSWYRKYSDGWIEQGGYVTTNSSTERTINLHTAFSNTNYFLTKQLGFNGYYGAGINGQYTSVWGLTTSSFKTYGYTTAGVNAFRWYACGY